MAEELSFPAPASPDSQAPPPIQLGGGGGLSALAAIGSFGMGRVMALFKPQRAVGTIIADVTIDEVARDDLEITRHPVEVGAAITDHSFKLPAEIIVRCGWSGTGFGTGYVNAVYAELLALQASRVPFTVTSGKRSYPDMLIASIGMTTDATTENGLVCQVTCRQVILVETQTTTVAPREQQAAPASTAPVEPAGGKQPAAVNNDSVLGTIGGYLSGIGSGLNPLGPAASTPGG